MTNNAQLLPLPEPTFKQVGIEQGTNRRVQISNYTADQMQSYALACIEAAKPADLCTQCAADGKCMKKLAICYANGTSQKYAKPDALGSLPVVLDRSDSVNLATNMINFYGCKGITEKGVKVLCEAVLLMDSAIATYEAAQSK